MSRLVLFQVQMLFDLEPGWMVSQDYHLKPLMWSSNICSVHSSYFIELPSRCVRAQPPDNHKIACVANQSLSRSAPSLAHNTVDSYCVIYQRQPSWLTDSNHVLTMYCDTGPSQGQEAQAHDNQGVCPCDNGLAAKLSWHGQRSPDLARLCLGQVSSRLSAWSLFTT